MLFTAPIFLFAFLPAVILGYYALKPLLGNRLCNLFLLLASYIFYLFGAGRFALILLGSTMVDYLLGLIIDRVSASGKWWVALSVVVNLGLLAYFKYTNFFIAEFNTRLATWGVQPLAWAPVALPIGISFFTFQKISYIVDVYRKNTRALTNFFDFGLYVAMFPQLVAGPIVRFKDIREQLRSRQVSWERFSAGAVRFCWGLAKKVLIADACGRIADAAFGLAPALLDTKTAWLGAVAYTFQIYFDFSGYSDMAIGLARLFGFELLENFDRPYAAVSITDFWRRWHISLSRWFKDYLYIPLGGNRKGSLRTYLNLLVVFGLCGLWHGANWTFVVWGFYHGLLLIVERAAGLRRMANRNWSWLARTLTFILLVFGWVVFRADTLSGALAYIKTMVLPVDRPLSYELYSVLHWRNIAFMALAALSTLGAWCLPTCETLLQAPVAKRTAAALVLILLVLPYCAAFVMAGTSHPFIYFRF
jgi:alginate O-acetyltransferase complex protein AlgI